MKLTQIRDLIAVAERGSLRGAARQLGTMQPSITRSIRELEHELGASLLERSITGAVLTPIGQAFLRRASTIQNELRRALDEVKQIQGEGTGTIACGLATVPQLALLPRVLGRFQKRYPHIRVNIVECLFPVVEAQLRDGTMDFYIGPASEDRLTAEFRVEKLFENQRLVFARKGHPLRHARSLRELTGARWAVSSVTVASEAEIGPVFQKLGLPAPAIGVQGHGALTMITTVASSDMLALLPKQWADFAQTSGLMEVIPIQEQIAGPDVCLISRAGLSLTPVAEHLCDLFRRAALHQSAPPAWADPAAPPRG